MKLLLKIHLLRRKNTRPEWPAITGSFKAYDHFAMKNSKKYLLSTIGILLALGLMYYIGYRYTCIWEDGTPMQEKYKIIEILYPNPPVCSL